MWGNLRLNSHLRNEYMCFVNILAQSTQKYAFFVFGNKMCQKRFPFLVILDSFEQGRN